MTATREMNQDRIHRATSNDGTEIAGRVHGQGPPLVFVSSPLCDGDTSWGQVPTLLEDRFTCYMMSTRGRGLSADSPDHSLERLAQDITSFAESIDGPVGLVGHSGGAMIGLAAAARTDAVSAVALYEPAAPSVLSEGDAERQQAAFGRVAAAAEEGRLVDGARIWCEECGLFSDEEVAALSESGAYEAFARFLPAWFRDATAIGGAIEATPLERITVPVLLMRGARTHVWFKDSARYFVDNLEQAQVVEIPDVAHLAPLLAPEPVANQLTRFFTAAPAAT